MIGYPQWYRINEVKFQMIRYTYLRESVFIKSKHSMKEGLTTRMIKMHNVQHIQLWLKQMYIFSGKRDYNLFYSLAHYKNGIPNGSLNLANRDFGNWVEEHWKEMDGFDFLLDIDADNHKEIGFAHYSASSIVNLFDKLEVPYHLRFSGMGFHFIIPSNYFSHLEFLFSPDGENNIYDLFMDIAMKLHKDYSEMIDIAIYDSRRVVKIPYSLALGDEQDYVCYPFKSKEEFDRFTLQEMLPTKVFNRLDNNPEHLFNPNGNVFKLLNELDLKKQEMM